MMRTLSTAPLPFETSARSAAGMNDTKPALAASTARPTRRACSLSERDASSGDELNEQDDERDHQQQVDERAEVEDRPAEQPQDQQDENDRPEHVRLTSSAGATQATCHG